MLPKNDPENDGRIDPFPQGQRNDCSEHENQHKRAFKLAHQKPNRRQLGPSFYRVRTVTADPVHSLSGREPAGAGAKPGHQLGGWQAPEGFVQVVFLGLHRPAPDNASGQIDALARQVRLAEPCQDLSASGIAQPDCRGKVMPGWGKRLPDVNRDGTAPWEPLARAQDGARPANDNGNDGDTCLAGDFEGPEMKGEQPGHAGERPFGEPGETFMGADRFQRVHRVGNTSRRIRPADEHRAEAAQERPCKGLFREFLLRHEGEVARDSGRQHGAIEIA